MKKFWVVILHKGICNLWWYSYNGSILACEAGGTGSTPVYHPNFYPVGAAQSLMLMISTIINSMSVSKHFPLTTGYKFRSDTIMVVPSLDK